MQDKQIMNSLGLPELSRRDFLRTTGQLGLAALVLPVASGRAEEGMGTEYAAGEIMLPFAYSMSRSSAPKPEGLDFSHQYGPDNCEVFIRIDGELWEFRSQWITNLGTTARYKGPDIDHMVRMEDGTYPDGMTACWFLGGMWYDEPERKLYAPMHVEQDGPRRNYPGCRKIALATSTDKGKSWRYEGDIITSETYYYARDFFKFSGSGYGNGVADFGFYADTRGGFFYVFPDEGWILRGADGARWNARAARCAISDKMAPGKWRYFYNGGWDEPALGGKASTVARVTCGESCIALLSRSTSACSSPTRILPTSATSMASTSAPAPTWASRIGRGDIVQRRCSDFSACSMPKARMWRPPALTHSGITDIGAAPTISGLM